MKDATFDSLARLLGSRSSRRQVLKGVAAGSALAAGAMTLTLEHAGAQCVADGDPCTGDAQCCSGTCGDSGLCITPENTCIEDGGLCQAGLYCCSGANCDNTGHCPASGNGCVADNGTCASDDDCCSGSCDDSGYCFTPENTCIEDGGLCQAGRYCCSGEDCAPGGHCPTSAVAVLPATGSGANGGQSAASGLIAPIAMLGAAAVVGARRLRPTASEEEPRA